MSRSASTPRRMRLALAFALAMAPSAALAQPAETATPATEGDPDRNEARALDQRGRDEFAKGEFLAAADSFARAHRMLPRAATKYNEAMSWEKASHLAQALIAYEEALSMGELDEERSAASQERVTRLRGEVGRIEIDDPPGARVTAAFHRDVPTPATLYVDPGVVTVKVSPAKGAAVERVVKVGGGQTVLLAIEAPAAPEATAPSASSTPVAGIILLGVAGAATIGAVVLGVQTLDAREEFDTSGRLDADARDRAVTLRAATNITAASAVIAGAVGAWLVLTTDDDAGVSSSVGVFPAAGSAGVVATFRLPIGL